VVLIQRFSWNFIQTPNVNRPLWHSHHALVTIQ
jgi:hypothetical protein